MSRFFRVLKDNKAIVAGVGAAAVSVCAQSKVRSYFNGNMSENEKKLRASGEGIYKYLMSTYPYGVLMGSDQGVKADKTEENKGQSAGVSSNRRP